MKCSRPAAVFSLCVCVACNRAPAEWKVMHNKTNVCQISVPPDWTVDPKWGSLAREPKDRAEVSVGNQLAGTVRPLSEETQKALMVDKLIENSSRRVFWANRPPDRGLKITPYHVFVPGKAGVCTALIAVHQGVSEELVKKIGATLSAVP